MEHEGSLPFSQQPVTCPYPEQEQSSRIPDFVQIRSNMIRLHLGLAISPFPPGFPTKILCASPFCPIDPRDPSIKLRHKEGQIYCTRHEGIWGSGGTAPYILHLDIKWGEWSASGPRSLPGCPLNGRLCAPPSLSGSCAEEINKS